MRDFGKILFVFVLLVCSLKSSFFLLKFFIRYFLNPVKALNIYIITALVYIQKIAKIASRKIIVVKKHPQKF